MARRLGSVLLAGGILAGMMATPAFAIEAVTPSGAPTGLTVPGTPSASESFRMLALRPEADWRNPFVSAPAPGSPAGLTLDLFPLSGGFRVSLGSGLQGEPADHRPSLGILPSTTPGEGATSTLSRDWYLGLGWSGDMGRRLSFDLDVGAVYRPRPGETDPLGLSAVSELPSSSDPLRLSPLLSFSLSYRF